MATIEIKVPSVGESVSEGILARWLKPDGSAVRKGEPLFELETDKATQEVAAEADGVLARRAREGDTVEVGQVVALLDTEAQPTAAAPAPATTQAAVAASTSPVTTAPPTEAPAIAPSVRRIATEQGIDIAQVSPTGPGGRVTKGDILDHLGQRPPAPVTTDTTPSTPPTALPGTRRETRTRMTGIRQRIAQRLVEAQHTAAILTTFNEVDMSAVMDLRVRYKEAFQKKHGVGLGFMSFFVKAAVEALRAFPAVNSRVEGNEIVQPSYHDIGVAVSTDRGLMVPVLRDAGGLSFAQIESAITAFATKARENKIAVDDLQGGTFTITNGGIFGSLLSTPILNPPQSGILGIHKIQQRPVVVDGQIVARPMMYLALSYDHRLIDGREAVSFLVRVKDCLEDPARLLIEV